MRYRALGRTGVPVSTLTLGTMNFGPFGGTDEEQTTAIVRRAVEAGITTIDTADAYGDGASEELVGRALQGLDRDELVIASKFRLPMGGRYREGGSRRWIVRAVEDSLRRLGTDRIDVYQMHRPDPDTDIEESLSALTDLQRAGKVLYLGSSTFSGAEVVEAQWASARRGLARFTTEQSPYSILERGGERDVLPTVRRHGMGLFVWSPLAGGFLSGKYRAGVRPTPTHRDEIGAKFLPPWDADDDRKRDAAESVTALADEVGIDVVELAVAWVLAHPAVTSAVIGPRTLAQLESQLGAGDRDLPVEVLDAIDGIVPPGTSFKVNDTMAVLPGLAPANRRR